MLLALPMLLFCLSLSEGDLLILVHLRFAASLKWLESMHLNGNIRSHNYFILYETDTNDFPARYELGPGGALGVHAL